VKAKGIFPISFLALAGCGSLQTRQQAALSKAVYAENRAIEVGRFDLAKKYSADAVKLIAPPKHQIDVKPIQDFVVVPEEQANKKTASLQVVALHALPFPTPNRRLWYVRQKLQSGTCGIDDFHEFPLHAIGGKRQRFVGFHGSVCVNTYPGNLPHSFGSQMEESAL